MVRTRARPEQLSHSPMTIKGNCSSGCGYVQILEVIVHVWPDSLTCSFTCAECGSRGVSNITAHVADLLDAAGCPTRRVALPKVEDHDGPPLTYDDLLDLSIGLRAADWWSELIPES